MRVRSWILLTASGLAACAVATLPSAEPYESWQKPGSSEVQFRGDHAACADASLERDSIVATRSPTPHFSLNETRFRECMEHRGWALER